MTALNEYYDFKQTPFSRTIAPTDLFPSLGHQEIQGRLAFALQERLPALITGDASRGPVNLPLCGPLSIASTATSFPSLTWPTPTSK